MGLAEDLLSQASSLLKSDKKKPKQASLRRAVSAAYYALFHFLVDRAVRSLVGASPADDKLRGLVSRRFSHATMNAACKQFDAATTSKPPRGKAIHSAYSGNLPSVPPTLADVAETFVDLQDARHDADYNLMRRFTRAETSILIQRVETAFKDWPSVASTPEAKLF